MEVAPIFTQYEASQPLEALSALALACGLTYVTIRAGIHALRPTIKSMASHSCAQVPSLARAFLVFGGPVAVAQPAVTEQLQSDHAITIPRLATSEFPPPRSLVRAGELSPSDDRGSPPGANGLRVHQVRRDVTVHPAIHRSSGSGGGQRLFVRAPSESADYRPPRAVANSDDAIVRGILDLRRAQRARSLDARTDGAHAVPKLSHYAVLPGDTLWDIAGKVLETKDMRAIARYWPLIHRANRDVIGADPNLICPGQVLVLPRIEQA